MKLLRYILTNLVFFGALYCGAVHDIVGMQYLVVTLTWMSTLVFTFVGTAISTEEGKQVMYDTLAENKSPISKPSVPSGVDWTVDIIFFCFMIYHGWFFTAGAYIVGRWAAKCVYSKIREMKEELDNEHN